MPFDNEYNRKIARDVDFNNRQYIAHCDNTGQGTQNYRVQISSFRGGGRGSKDYHYNSSESDEEKMDGGAILGLQAGTVLGGPKARGELPTRKQIVSTSSLGAPLRTNNATIAETNDETTPNVEPSAEEPKEGGAILGVKPVRFGTTPFGKKSYLSSQVIPPSGKMYRAGRYVSVRDLGDTNVNYKSSRYESSSEDESSSDEEAVKKGQALLSVEIKGSAKPMSLAGLRDSSKVKDASNSLNQFYSNLKKEGVKIDEDKKDGAGRGLDLDGGKRMRIKPKAKARAKPRARTSTSTSARTSTRPSTTSARTSGTTSAKNRNRPSTSAPKKKSLYAKALEGIDVVGKSAKQITDLIVAWKQNNPLEAQEYADEGDYGEPQPEDEEPEDEEDEDEEGEEGAEEEEEEVDEEEKEAPDTSKADTDKKLSDISSKVEELGGPKTGPKWYKERDAEVSDVKGMEPIGKILGFQMYSEDPVGDWIKAYSDSFGDFKGLSPEEMINQLYILKMKDKDIQAYLKQSQGASKANESRGVSSTLTSARVTPRDIGNKNKNTACLDGYNNVANKNETAQRETRPVRQNTTYFGQSGGYFKKTLKATRGKDELKVVPKAQMQGSTMSGFGKPEAQMHSSSMSGMGMPMNEKKRKAELRKMGKDELKAVASKHDVKCRGKVNGKTRTLKKGELIDEILKCEYKMKGSGTTLENTKEINDMLQQYKKKPAQSGGPVATQAPGGKETIAKSDGPVATQAPGTQMVANGKPADKKLLKSAPKKNKRADIVRKVMKEKNLSMIEASKYVKANNLY